jgi:hypothetical protein
VMRLHDGRIAGIVMEKANGRNVDKTLMDPQYVYSSSPSTTIPCYWTTTIF